MTEKGRDVGGLQISVLGSPRVVVDGRPIEVDTRKAIALLTYLAVTARPQGRDRLTGLLWPDYEQEKARAALRRTLSTLKAALGGRWIVADRMAISLDQEDVDLDLDRFRTLLDRVESHPHASDEPCPRCATDLTEATSTVTGSFLAGFVLRDAEPFEEWQSLEAEAIERDFADALDGLVRARVALGDLEGATSAVQQNLALDPLDEPAHRQLMQIYAWRGMRSNALQHYRDCVAILDRELGVAPLRETTELYEAIADGRIEPLGKVELATPTTRSRAGRPATTYRLHGRDAEWELLEQAYAAADGWLVVLEGEAGIGKTRLAREFLEHAATQGAATAAVRSHEGESGLPYALMTELLAQIVERVRDIEIPLDALAEAGRLVPALQREAPAGSIEDPGGLTRFYEGLRTVLTAALAGDRPGVMLLDDLHWSDTASVEALGYIVRRLSGTPIMLIATWRSEEVDQDDRLRRMADEALRSGHSLAMQLGRLGDDDVIGLVSESGLPADRTGEIAQRLIQETEGIPFFVVEYLAVARSETSPSWELPLSIKDLLRSRVTLVGQMARQVLGTAAVIDRSFDFDIVWRASGRTELEVVDALEELVRHGLIAPAPATPAPDLSYDFSHEKLRTFMYDSMSPARRRVLHRRVAEAFAQAARRDAQRRVPDLIARHYELGGNEVEAASYRELAAERASAVYANREALDHYLAALSLGHPEPSRMHRGAGDMYVLLGEYNKALNSYQAAAAHSAVEDVAALEQRIGEVHQRRGDWDLSQNHFAAALESLTDDADVARSRLFSAMSFNCYRMGAHDEARALATRALEASAEADDPRARAHAQNMLGILDNARGDHAGAEKALRDSLRLADELDDAGGRAAALNNLALSARSRGDLDRALELTLEALDISARQGDRHHEAALHNNIADLLHNKGETEQAMQHLKQATATLAEIGDEPTGMLPEVWKLVEW